MRSISLNVVFFLFVVFSTTRLSSAPFSSCFHVFQKGLIERSLFETWLHSPSKKLRYSQLGMEWEGQIPEAFKGDAIIQYIKNVLLESGYHKNQVHLQKGMWETEIWLSHKKLKRKFWFPTESFPTEVGFEAAEIAFPVVYRKAQLSLNYKSLSRLQEIGARASSHAGIHFHFDAKGITNLELAILAKIYSHLRPQIAARWGIHKNREVHIQNFNKTHYKAILKKPHQAAFAELPSFLDHLFPGYFIRLNPYLKTFEIRYFNSHLNPLILKEQIMLSKLIYDAVRNKSGWIVSLLENKSKLTIDNILSFEVEFKFPGK